MSETAIVVVVVGGVFTVALFALRAQMMTRMSAELATLAERTAGHRATATSEMAQLTSGLARNTDMVLVKDQAAKLSEEMLFVRQGLAQASKLSEEMLLLRQGLDASISNLKRAMSEERDAFERRVNAVLETEIGERAAQHIEDHAVPRVEFERLRTRVDRLVGAEELAERTEIARMLFDSADLRVMTWQCKVIRMLDGGLAPEAEQDAMAAAGIPLTAARDFLKRLQEMEVAVAKKVTSYWATDAYQWLLVAAEDPSAIRSKIEAFARNEAEYQSHIVSHLESVEEGLVLVAEQWELPTGRVDIKARDAAGLDAYIELKYPSASSSAYAQVLKYRQDVISQPGAPVARFMLVAPKVSVRVQELLGREAIEWKEVPY